MEGYAYGPSQLYSNPTMPGTQFQYQPGYLQDQSRQQYAQYQSHMMYEAQQQPQPQSQSSYEPISEYQRSQSRQTATVDLMANQYGEPQQYYSPDENMTRSGPPAVSEAYVAPYARTQHHLTHTTEPTKTIGRSGLSSTYPTLTTHHTQESEVEVDAEADTLEEHGPNSQGDQLRSYQRALCETNEDTSRGKLREASSSLKQLTKWLLNRAAALGRLERCEPRISLLILLRAYQRHQTTTTCLSAETRNVGQFQQLLASLSAAPKRQYN